MKNIVLTSRSYEIIVSTIINAKMEAEKGNKNGINDAYIKAVNIALKELKGK